MDALTYARAQMGLSLAFHIVFAAAGVALPLVMVIADALHLRTGDPDYLTISKRMAKGTAILFAVGAVSGTVLSFELGLLWPRFMGTFGEVVGLPFALEGFAFFAEAICLGIYLYGRGRLSPRAHLLAGVGVAASGALSAAFVTTVNAFMNLPSGFVMEGGRAVAADPLAVMLSSPWKYEVPHTLLSCYQATAFVLSGVHAAALLRRPKSALFRKALAISLALGCVTAVLQPLVGDLAAKQVAREQPIKLAALEGQFETRTHAPLRIGGLPDPATGEVRWAIEIPSGLSFLLTGDPASEVKGLEAFPRDEWPKVAAVHVSFQVMVGAGVVMLGLALATAWLAWRKRGLPDGRRYLWAVVATSPLGVVAMEAGWLVTELGRQPWVVRGAMRTSEAVTPIGTLAPPFWLFTVVYLFLGAMVVYLLRGQVRAASESEVGAAPGAVHAD